MSIPLPILIVAQSVDNQIEVGSMVKARRRDSKAMAEQSEDVLAAMAAKATEFLDIGFSCGSATRQPQVRISAKGI